MNKSHSSATPKIVGATLLVAIVSIAVYTLLLAPNNTESSAVALETANSSQSSQNSSTTSKSTIETTQTTTTPSNTSSSSTSSNQTTVYRDGTYTASKVYNVPHAQNTIDVTITVEGEIVTAISVNDDYTDHESAEYISSFESAIKSKVVGKKLADISLSRVGGASLTTSAFSSALGIVKSDASS